MRNLLYILIALVFTSCEDPIELDRPVGEIRYSVEGEITTVEKKYEVFVSTTTVFDATMVPFVENAKVTLFDNSGNTYEYEYADSGVYVSKNIIKGEVGKSYYIEVTLENGDVIKSYPEIIRKVPPIDSLYSIHVSEYTYVGGPPREIDDAETGYFLFFDAEEQKGVVDYYRWKGYVNGVYQSQPEALFYVNDVAVDGSEFIGFDLPFLAQLGDTVVVDQLSASKRYYDYLFSLDTEIQPGGIFSTPPAPVIGNLYLEGNTEEIIFGYFSASDVSSATHVVVGTKK